MIELYQQYLKIFPQGFSIGVLRFQSYSENDISGMIREAIKSSTPIVVESPKGAIY